MMEHSIKRKMLNAILVFMALPLYLLPLISWATPPAFDMKFYEAIEDTGNYYWISETGTSLLEIAIEARQPEMALRLLDHDALNHLDPSHSLASVFFEAFNGVGTEVIKKIIELTKRDGTFSAMPLLDGISYAITAGDSRTVNFLLEEEISFEEVIKKNPELLAATIWERQYAMAWALIGRGVLLGSVNAHDWKALQVSVLRGNKELVIYLLEQGADFVTNNSDGINAMGLAISNAGEGNDPNFVILDLLVEKGADPCDKNLKIIVAAKNDHRDPIQQFVKESSNKAFLEKFASYKCKFTD